MVGDLERIEQLEEEVKELEQDIEKKDATISELEDRIAELEGECGGIREAKDALVERLKHAAFLAHTSLVAALRMLEKIEKTQ